MLSLSAQKANTKLLAYCSATLSVSKQRGQTERRANRSFERTACQLVSHVRRVVSLRLHVAGGQPLNSSVRQLKKQFSMWALRINGGGIPWKSKLFRPLTLPDR